MAKITHCNAPNMHQPEDVTEAAEHALGGWGENVDDPDRLQRRASNNSDAIGELLDLLMDKGLLDSDDVKRVLGLV